MSRDPSHEVDRRWMREALRLAARARGRTAPNPLVGCVIVRGSERVASGLHVRVGRAHAEAVALAKAGSRARGATLYVNLEPCAHHGRTPPCVESVLASGVRRVVIGMRDPDPRTAGRGIRRLRRAGVDLTVGVLEEACRELNRGFESRICRKRPFTTLKLASSWDGRVATGSGESRWITGEKARQRVHLLRARVDAVAVGSRTARLDDPQLTARRGERVVHRPRRVVIDSRLGLSPGARLLAAEPAGSAWIFCGKGASPRRRRTLERAGAQVFEAPMAGEHLDLAAVWGRLADLGVNDLLVEGGGQLGAALLRAGLVDRLHLFLAPLLIGQEGRPVLGPLGIEGLEDAPRPAHWDLERIGPDLLLTAGW